MSKIENLKYFSQNRKICDHKKNYGLVIKKKILKMLP